MNTPSFLNKQATKIYNKFSSDPGNLLLITGTVGWILSSIAHVGGIVFNKEIPSDQKKFLIPQEIADGVINILSFFAITHAATILGKFLVKSGKISTPKIMEFMTDNKLTSKIGKKGFDISKTPNFDTALSKDGKPFNTHYFHIEDGVAFVASTTGSIVSSNILTPILRNKYAAGRQKESIAKEKLQNEGIMPASPVLPAQNRFGIDDYKSKAMNAPRVTTGGSMRI